MQSNSLFRNYIFIIPCLIVCLTILSESMIKFCIVISTYYGREQNYILYQNNIQKFLKNMTYDKKVKRFRFYYVLLLNIWTLKYATSIRAVTLYAIIIHYTTIVLYFSHWISQRFAITSCWKVINLHQNIIICWWHVVEYLMQKSGSVS